ncbi:MAG: radical SAM protein [Candidatus Bathyarchaeia archaeon]
MASACKVAYHRKKIEAYLRGEQITPATVEMDISSLCDKRCENCPSTTSEYNSTLDVGFIESVFARLEGETRGLILSGGEPTLAPSFPDVLRLAREYGFIDIAIVTNGGLLNKEKVTEALCAHASSVRVSVYDWTKESREELQTTLERIRALKSCVERAGSRLQIGVSALTNRENADSVPSVAQEVYAAGADWIYFHPMCIRWEVGAPERVDQSGVLAKIKECQELESDGFQVHTFPDRYVEGTIDFSGYHAAHFLLVIGADGINYLGAEVKYHQQYAIADVAKNWSEGFLWQQERLKRIDLVTSLTYPAVASRHRGILYSHLIQDLINRGERSLDQKTASYGAASIFPHIL